MIMATYRLHWPNTLAQNARIRLYRAPVAAIIVASLIAGCLAGWLLVGWVIWPVQYTGDAYTYELNPAEKIQYVAAVADSYAMTRQIDVVRQRLQTWTVGEKAGALGQLYAEDQAQGKAMEAAVVADLAFQLRRWEGWDPMTVDQATAQLAAQYNRQGAPSKAQAVSVFATTLGTAPAPVAAASPPSATPQEILPAIPSSVFLLCGTLLVLVLAAGVFFMIRHRASRTPVPATKPAQPGDEVAGAAILMQQESVYELGMDEFDAIYPIHGHDGEWLGECGVNISTTLNEDPPRKVTAFEVWLFAKTPPNTTAKVLASDAVYRDAGLRDQLSSRGPLVLAAPDAAFALETGCLAVDARVARLGYGDGTRSYFDRLTLSLAARQVDEVVMPMDA
jgi:hypothetical protein